MPVRYIGPVCARRGCARPIWDADLCHGCLRLAHSFGKDPQLFAYEPADGYAHDTDAIAFPWDEWEARGMTLDDLLAEGES